MTGLEDRLHRALDLDLETEVAPRQMLEDVRRGAKRRQVRRRTAGVVAAAVVLVAGVVGGGALLTGGEREPRPAPRPSETATDPNQPVVGSMPGRALQVEAAGGQVFATSNEDDCGCSAFWRFDGTAWERLHDFPVDSVERLAMAPDGRNGWATSPSGPVWATHDGGNTWAKTWKGGAILGASNTHVWLLDTADGGLRRSAVAGDDFEAVPVSGAKVLWDVQVLGEAVVATAAPEGEGSVTATPLVSRDGGETWEELAAPCGEARVVAAGTAAFVACADGQQVTIHRSTDLTSWQEFGVVEGTGLPVALAEDAVLVGRTLLTEGGASEVDPHADPGAIWDAAALDGTIYLATSDGIRTSTDGGRTWQPADSSTDRAEDPTTTDDTPPATAAAVPSSIPDEYPLAAGLETQAESEQPGREGPNRALAALEFPACDTTLPDAAHEDRLRASFTNVEYLDTRQLTTYADADAAVAAVAGLVNFYRDCPTETDPVDPNQGMTHEVRRTSVGGESWSIVSSVTMFGTPSAGLTITHVIRLGLAVLVLQESGEGGAAQDREATIQRRLDQMTARADQPIAALCRFTVAGC